MSTRLLLLGHRGARDYAPENTLAAFDLALKHSVDGFEFDVRRTRDGHLIICHDPRLNRLSVRKHTLRQLRASFASAEEQPPCLEDVLKRYSRAAFLNIEVKVRGAEREIANAVKDLHPRRGYCISSFLPGVVRKLHALDGSLTLGIICQTRWQLRRWKTLPVSYVMPHYRLLSRRLVKRMHAADKTVITWTVNQPRKMRRAATLGVNGIISDDTKLLLATLRTH
ncbi:MAG TPA: glycerophosphodiester phosphodiesterase [Verrucomicrobiae bacterium]|nr:glycerophosphodiester phosphodiesterase [Verrucomicrobiae bacterium]